MKMMNGMTCFGAAISSRTALGIAPKNGPKNGITLVTPIITLISATKFIFMKDIAIKHKIPIISESRSLPDINPDSVEFAFEDIFNMLLQTFFGKTA